MSILKKKKNNAYPLHIKKMKLKIFRLKKNPSLRKRMEK